MKNLVTEKFISNMMEIQPLLSNRLKMPLNKDVMAMDLSVPHLLTLKLVIQSKIPPKIGEIGENLSVSFAMMTRIIDRLESGGLVKRVRNNKDRRIIRIEPTLKGFKFGDKFRRQHMKNIMDFLETLETKDRELFVKSISNIMNILIKYNKEGDVESIKK